MPSAMCGETAKPYHSEDLDEQRRQNVAYEYLCRLEETKKWMEDVLHEQLPASVSLEESLRHGVYLAKLAVALAPGQVTGKIFDADLERYTTRGLHFRHTDNINMWLRSLQVLGLPSVFIPTTTDLYERKNMPKVIYCLHALSLLAFKLGKSEQMEELVGRAEFAASDIDSVSTELRRHGLVVPAFNKIGGILAREMPVDKSSIQHAAAAVDAAIADVENGVDESGGRLMKCLRSAELCLNHVLPDNAVVYCRTLVDARRRKIEAGRSFSEVKRESADTMLTQLELQGHVAAANNIAMLAAVNNAVHCGDVSALAESLSRVQLSHVLSDNAQYYLQSMSCAQRSSGRRELCLEQLQLIVDQVNADRWRSQRMQMALVAVNECLVSKDEDEHKRCVRLIDELCFLGLERTRLVDWAAPLFLREMATVRLECGRDLDADAIRGAVSLLPALAAVNAAVNNGDAAALIAALLCRHALLMDVDEMAATRYLSTMQRYAQRTTTKTRSSITFLTHQEVQEAIDDVNRRSEDERHVFEIISDINSAVRQSNIDSLRLSLSDQLLQLPHCLVTNQSILAHCMQVMQLCLQTKQHNKQDQHVGAGNHGDGVHSDDIWLDNVGECVELCLQHHSQASSALAALTTINSQAETLSAHQFTALLSDSSLSLSRVSTALSEQYLSSLIEHRRRLSRPQTVNSWMQHTLSDGFDVYFRLADGSISWTRPHSAENGGGDIDSALIDCRQLQLLIDQVNSGVNPDGCVSSSSQRSLNIQSVDMSWLVMLQAAARGCLVRRKLRNWRQHCLNHVYQIIRLQAWWRGVIQRRSFLLTLAEKRQREIVALRDEVCRLRERDVWEREVLSRFSPFLRHVMCIQQWWRQCRVRIDLSQLASTDRPNIALVRRFVHLLDVSGADFREEILLQKLKGNVAQVIRKNQQLEKDLDSLDIKIGLLVKNRISLQEVLMHSRSVDGLAQKSAGSAGLNGVTGCGSEGSATPQKSSTGGLKALTKESRRRLHLYQELFYLLQTEPQYLARLVFALPAGQSGRCLDSVVFSIFSYGANERDEYLLVRLFRLALQTEVRCRVERPTDLATGSAQVVRLLVQYCRRHSLQPLLEPLVAPVVADRCLQINTNPVDVYRHWINEQETRTGQPCGLPYHVSAEEALTHEEVRSRIAFAIDILKKESTRFMERLFSCVSELPYCLLYMAKVMKQALHDKFPEVAEKDVLKIVGNLVYYRFINSAIIAPDAFNVIQMSASESLTSDQRKNLGSIAKILQFAASKKGFGTEASHLCSLNPFIIDAHERFKNFLMDCCKVSEPDVHYGRHEFSEATEIAKPIIFITAQEICELHSQLLTHRTTVVGGENNVKSDPLAEILDELGQPLAASSIVSGGGMSGPTMDSSPERTEICLTLSARPSPADDGRLSIEKTFLQCKQLLIDVIRCTDDPDVASCARREPTAVQERIFKQLQQQRGCVESRRHGNHLLRRTESTSGVPICGSLEETKDALLERLRILERAGRVSREDDYNVLVTAVVSDICHQRRYRQQRRRQLVRLRSTLMSLGKKTAFHQEQAAYYSQYLNQCLCSMNTATRNNLKSTTTASTARTNGNTSASLPVSRGRRAVGPVQYTAARLKEKGVLLAIDGVRPCEMRSVQLEIASHASEEGVFVVTGRMLGVSLDQVTVRLADLLQLQYDGVAVLNMFGRAKINVNLLIFLINRKFYGKQAR